MLEEKDRVEKKKIKLRVRQRNLEYHNVKQALPR